VTHVIPEVLDALREAGVSETTARAAAAAVPDMRHLATKEDLARLASELRALIPDISHFATKEDLAQLAGELRLEMSELRSELRSDIRMLKFLYGPLIIGLLIKIAFFP